MLRRFLLLLLATAGLVSAARAHDPFLTEIETETTADTLVLRILLARSVAGHLAGLTPNPRAYFAPADFSARQADFDRLAGRLCLLSLGEIPLAPRQASAALGPDAEEIVFTLTYPRPAAKKVRLECAWLSRLPEGYAASTQRGVASSAGLPRLTAENPSAYLALAPAAPSP